MSGAPHGWRNVTVRVVTLAATKITNGARSSWANDPVVMSLVRSRQEKGFRGSLRVVRNPGCPPLISFWERSPALFMALPRFPGAGLFRRLDTATTPRFVIAYARDPASPAGPDPL